MDNKANTLKTLKAEFEDARQAAIDYDLLQFDDDECNDYSEAESDDLWTAVHESAEFVKAVMTEEDWATYEDEIQDEQGR
jgi:hypothetical protein